jgi:hypothetical protein
MWSRKYSAFFPAICTILGRTARNRLQKFSYLYLGIFNTQYVSYPSYMDVKHPPARVLGNCNDVVHWEIRSRNSKG